jgi:hypothetical protein|eukprot:3478058-Prymnesium_polylepis.1
MMSFYRHIAHRIVDDTTIIGRQRTQTFATYCTARRSARVVGFGSSADCTQHRGSAERSLWACSVRSKMQPIGFSFGTALWAFTAVTAAASEMPRGLVVFTLVRGGPSEADFDSFVHSRRCLHEAMPAGSAYDDVAFHEGNVPLEVRLTLRERM